MGKLKALGKQKEAGASNASEVPAMPATLGITDAEKVYLYEMRLQGFLQSHQIANHRRRHCRPSSQNHLIFHRLISIR
jgi:hypothetical protein